MLGKIVKFALAGIALAFANSAHAQDCTLKQFASLDMEGLPNGMMVVPLTVNGTPRKFLLNLGTSFSSMHKDVADQLGLSVIPRKGMHYRFDGVDSPGSVMVSLGAGSAKYDPFKLIVAPTLPSSNFEGMIGLDFLSRFEVELDFKAGKLNLFSQDHCPGKLIYWSSNSATAIPFDFDGLDRITVPALLDGHAIDASLTTSVGAEMSLEVAASMFDFNMHSPQLIPSGSDGKEGVYYRYPMKALVIGHVTIENPAIDLLPSMNECDGRHTGSMRGAFATCHGLSELFLGLNELRKLHTIISFKERTLYFTGAN